MPPRLPFSLVAFLAACQATTAPVPPALPAHTDPAQPAAADVRAIGVAAPDTSEHPSARCNAPHPIAELPLSSVKVDDWAQAIASYRPQANGGRPVAWEGDANELEGYLENMHACVHTAFVDSFLRSLGDLPKDHALSDPELGATVEVVVEGETGRLADVGIVASSGVPEFDAAAVAAFGHAFPLPPAPAGTWSSDGRLYVTWELRRRPEDGCKRSQARAWKLRF